MEKTGEKRRGVGGRKRETERQTERERGGRGIHAFACSLYA